ncbi:efflux RND transporter permease subunit [Pantoea ananatis]
MLLGTFCVIFAFGYSINTLTMFAMVLAIGLLVDDAIVVVENVERIMSGGRDLAARCHPQIDGANPGGHWSELRWYSPLYLFLWPFLVAPSGQSTASFR